MTKIYVTWTPLDPCEPLRVWKVQLWLQDADKEWYNLTKTSTFVIHNGDGYFMKINHFVLGAEAHNRRLFLG